MIDEHEQLFYGLGFCKFHDVRGAKSVKGVVPKEEACGIYCLQIEDEYFYIGKSIDIITRFSAHKKKYSEINHFSYIYCSEEKHDDFEEYCIHTADEAGVKILNRQYASHPLCMTGLHEILPQDEQDEWINDEIYYDNLQRKDELCSGTLFYAKGKHKFEALIRNKHYETILHAASSYTASTIPNPAVTEKDYWSVSCMPSRGGMPVMFCFNIFRIETFVLFCDEKNDTGSAFINVARSVLLEQFDSIENVIKQYNSVEYDGPRYQNAGADHCTLNFDVGDDLFNALNDSRIIKASKVLNLRMMNKGKNFYGHYHSAPFAEAIMKQVSIYYSEEQE